MGAVESEPVSAAAAAATPSADVGATGSTINSTFSGGGVAIFAGGVAGFCGTLVPAGLAETGRSATVCGALFVDFA